MEQERLLRTLLERGLLDEKTVRRLERESDASGKLPEAIIYDEQLVEDAQVARVKSEMLKIPYREISSGSIPQELLDSFPEETVRTYGVVPLEGKEGMLVAGMVNPDDQKSQEALRFLARRNKVTLGVYIISYGAWQDVLRRYSPYKNEIEKAVQSLRLKPDASRQFVELEAKSDGEDAPIIRIVAQTLREAAQADASDVHIEPQKNYLRVRFRKGGDLEEAASLPVELSQPVVSRVKVMSNLRIDETRIPQDGRFRTKIFDREIDFRVSTFPTPLGEKVAIRVLDPKTGLKKLDELGLVGRNLETIKNGVARPFGMILISGPTGSGKTTTLYAALQYLNKEKINIVSLEDPVEYFIHGVNQSQVVPAIGYDFASGLRQILRQDPDVIMVGEIRDNETAGLAIHAALTGHVVLSTIHTNDAIGVIPRLVDMGVEQFLLPSALNLMVAQRLVPLLCEKCRTEEKASPPIQKIIEEALKDMSDEEKKPYRTPYIIYRSEGCGACNGKGVRGRTALYEVLAMTPSLSESMNTGVTTQKVFAEARRQGMISMRSDGIIKALRGLVQIETVIRETSEIM